jgi:hypothetical protein
MAKSKLNKLPVSNAEMPSPSIVMPRSKEHEERERHYRAEDALGTIEKAEKHKLDKNLMKDVKKLVKEKVKTFKKI